MTDIVKGMVRAYHSHDSFSSDEAMRAALRWFAANASEKIAAHVCRSEHGIHASHSIPAPILDTMTDYIAAAICAAAGDMTDIVKGPECEWTFEGGKLFSAQCGGGWWRIEDYQRCPSCGRPIKRKSEAHDE